MAETLLENVVLFLLDFLVQLVLFLILVDDILNTVLGGYDDISDYSSVEVISGATMTSNGYKSAIGAALESFKILTGGNE